MLWNVHSARKLGVDTQKNRREWMGFPLHSGEAMSVLVKTVLSAVQEHEEVICSNHTQKIRRMTGSNVKKASFAERQFQRKIVRKDQEMSRRITTLCIPDSIQYSTCFKNYDVLNAKATTVCDSSPLRGIQKLQRHFREVRATVSSGTRDLTPSYLEIPKSTSGAMGHGWTWSVS